MKRAILLGGVLLMAAACAASGGGSTTGTGSGQHPAVQAPVVAPAGDPIGVPAQDQPVRQQAPAPTPAPVRLQPPAAQQQPPSTGGPAERDGVPGHGCPDQPPLHKLCPV